MGLDGKSLPPQTFDELAERLREQMPRLSAAHRQLAQRILRDPEGTAFQSIKDLAELVGVNQSTVVRFAQAAGLPGFPALRRLCEQHLTRQAQLVRRFDQLTELEETSREFLEHTAQLDRHNISRTFARVDLGMWEAIVGKISQARAVHVIGLRKSFAPAYLLWYLLQLTREDVFAVTPDTGTLVDKLRRIGPGDVCVAISIHRYAHDTVKARPTRQTTTTRAAKRLYLRGKGRGGATCGIDCQEDAQRFQCTTSSRGLRPAGLKAVPSV